MKRDNLKCFRSTKMLWVLILMLTVLLNSCSEEDPLEEKTPIGGATLEIVVKVTDQVVNSCGSDWQEIQINAYLNGGSYDEYISVSAADWSQSSSDGYTYEKTLYFSGITEPGDYAIDVLHKDGWIIDEQSKQVTQSDIDSERSRLKGAYITKSRLGC